MGNFKFALCLEHVRKWLFPPLAWAEFEIKIYIAFWSVEPTDFKNVIVENIPPALSEDAEVAEVKRPQNDENSIIKSDKN